MHVIFSLQIILHSVPGPPGGVSAVELTSDSGTIVWTDGAIYGRPIVNYRIEGRTNHDPTWRILADKVVGNEIEHLGHRAKIHGRRQVRKAHICILVMFCRIKRHYLQLQFPKLAYQ